MDKVLHSKNLIVFILTLVLIVVGFALAMDVADAATTGKVYNTGADGLNVRSGPGTNYPIIYGLSDGNTVTIIEKTDEWYKVSYSSITGYVSAKYIKVDTTKEEKPEADKEPVINKEYVYNEDFEDALEAEGFPESYKYYLRQVHANHPDWVFKAQHTNISWKDAVAKESQVSVNLVHKSANDSWKSREYGAIDSKGNYVEFDSGGWVAASSGIIKYYMDPRNFLNENDIFQFMSHSYDSKTQNKSGLQDLVAGTFLSNKFPEKGYETYSDILLYAGKNANANPYVLASMILVEQGEDGSGKSISGKVAGYEGYYNYFNVNAYAKGSYDAVEYGLLYAKSSGSYDRPWNSRTKSIIGGALHYATNYIKNNQNTLYLKKFNVMNGLDKVATHQYMTNVSGAAQEGANLKNGYDNTKAITFYIPVYKDMPEVACEKPGEGNNDYFLRTLEVAGYDLLPKFSMYTDTYEVVVPSETTKVSINAVANNSASKVKGSGTVQLSGNLTEIPITVTASSGEKKVYTITVAKQSNTKESVTSTTYKVGNNITGVDYNTTVETFKKNLSAPSGYSIKVVDKDGKALTSGNIGTGAKVILYKEKDAVKTTPVVIKGDSNGDGKLSSTDVLFAQRYIVGTYSLDGAYYNGADINGDGKISSVDILYMQRHIVGTYDIKQ